MDTLARMLVLGKRGGILHWYEDVLAGADGQAFGFPLNHHDFMTRMAGHLMGKRHPKVRQRVQQGLVETLHRLKPELVLIVDCFYLEPEIDRLLKEYGAPVIQWIGDRFEDALARNTCVRQFCFTDSGLMEPARKLGLPGISYLPLAANAPVHPMPAWESRRSEVLFIGAPSANRIKLLQSLQMPLRIIGPRWPRFDNPLIQVSARRVSVEKARQLYLEHKFVLNVINTNNIISGLPARCFDATAHGACLLTDNVADLARNFVPGREVVAYLSAQDLSARMASLLAGEAESIAAAGYRRTLGHHTFAHRLATLQPPPVGA